MQRAEGVLIPQDGDFLEVLRGSPIGEVTAVADAMVDGRDSPGRNRGDKEIMKCTLTRDAGLVKFDVSGVDRPIEKATLKCYCNDVAWRRKRPVAVYETGRDWSEMNVTWHNKPGAGPQLVGDRSYDIPGWWVWESDDLTDYVERRRKADGIVSLGLDNSGGGLYGSTSGLHYGVDFRTKEHDPAKAPKLDLVHGGAPPPEEAPPWWEEHATELLVAGTVFAAGTVYVVHESMR